jgi:hypothetical protein
MINKKYVCVFGGDDEKLIGLQFKDAVITAFFPVVEIVQHTIGVGEHSAGYTRKELLKIINQCKRLVDDLTYVAESLEVDEVSLLHQVRKEKYGI